MIRSARVVEAVIVLFSGASMTLAGWTLNEVYNMKGILAAGIERDKQMSKDIATLDDQRKETSKDVRYLQTRVAIIDSQMVQKP